MGRQTGRQEELSVYVEDLTDICITVKFPLPLNPFIPVLVLFLFLFFIFLLLFFLYFSLIFSCICLLHLFSILFFSLSSFQSFLSILNLPPFPPILFPSHFFLSMLIPFILSGTHHLAPLAQLFLPFQISFFSLSGTYT